MSYYTTILNEPFLVHYYKLDEISGTTVIDSKGSVTGTYHGTSGFNQSNLGKLGIPAGGTSVQFLGASTSSDYANIGAMTVGLGNLSLEGWIYLPSDPGVAQNFLNWHTGAIFGGSLYLSSARIPHWQIIDTPGGNPDIAANGAISINSWHHIVGKCNSNGTIRMYVDGVLQAASGAVLTPTISNSAREFWLASDGSNLIGRIDEVAIYNDALTDSTVLNHYNQGIHFLYRRGFTNKVGSRGVI